MIGLLFVTFLKYRLMIVTAVLFGTAVRWNLTERKKMIGSELALYAIPRKEMQRMR
jgi:predicted nucleotidyltransferase